MKRILKHTSGDDIKISEASVFNPFIKSDDKTSCDYGAVEYFSSESDALKYIGSFLI